MSIADDEAEKAYPTRYWDGARVKEQFCCDTDDLQEAYLRGRNLNRYYEDMSTPQPLPKLQCDSTILAVLANEN